MLGPPQPQHARLVGLHAGLAVVGIGADPGGRRVGAVIGIGEFVVLGLAEAPRRDAQLLPELQLRLRLDQLEVVEQPPVAHLVARDMGGDLLEHRLLGRVAHRRIIRGRARFHDAAGDQLAPLGAAHRAVGVLEMRRLVAFAEGLEGRLEIELGVRQLHPAAEREPVLGLLMAPLFENRVHGGVAGEDGLQIADIVARIVFDHRGGLHRHQEILVNLARIESLPRDIVERPARLRHGPNPCAVR